MLNLLMRQGVEVSRAPAEITVGGESFAAGSYVVRLDQPYRNYAVDLLSPQKFPADSPNQPYDDVSWALSVHYGVEAVVVDDENVRELELVPIEEEIRPRGEVRGTGQVYLLADTGQEALLAARFRLGTSIEVSIAEEELSVAGQSFPAGSWILEGEDVREALDGLARELALDGGLVRGVYGYPEITSAFRGLLPVYGVRRADRGRVVLQWGTRPPAVERDEDGEDDEDDEDDGAVKLLVSGGLAGGEELEGRPAILDVREGQGLVVAYNFNPIHRDLNHSDHRFFWNAILNWSYLRKLD